MKINANKLYACRIFVNTCSKTCESAGFACESRVKCHLSARVQEVRNWFAANWACIYIVPIFSQWRTCDFLSALSDHEWYRDDLQPIVSSLHNSIVCPWLFFWLKFELSTVNDSNFFFWAEDRLRFFQAFFLCVSMNDDIPSIKRNLHAWFK